ncbi:MAG TPA: NAD(P)H-dependent oxidoreductase [Gemmatimonadaceae bacterium]|nr:NAD(P)H-dependent oxidoreductase [Gemmatimonadaceae bacterium]
MANDDRQARRPVKVLVFGASLRKASLNDRLAEQAATVAEQKGATVDRATMRDFDCPAYDQDVEVGEGLPEGARRLRDRLVASDAYMIASPEYNSSVPGYLKNAIDWASRYRPQPFNGRQGLLLSASPSMVGGNRGLWSLRIPLEHLGSRVYPDMFSLAQAHEAFGADGRIENDTLRTRFESTIECFLDLVEAAKHYRSLKKQWVEFLGEHPNSATDRVEHTPVDTTG